MKMETEVDNVKKLQKNHREFENRSPTNLQKKRNGGWPANQEL